MHQRALAAGIAVRRSAPSARQVELTNETLTVTYVGERADHTFARFQYRKTATSVAVESIGIERHDSKWVVISIMAGYT